MTDQQTRAPRKRKRIRLSSETYAQPGSICSVTIAVERRRPIFASSVVASSAVDVLRSHAASAGVPIYAYCVMPDHVQLVLGPSPSCDIVTFVGQFKNLAQRAAWQHGVQGTFWQKSFWDHFLRMDEDLNRVVEYVLNNPVRQQLVNDWREYPFLGSLVLHL